MQYYLYLKMSSDHSFNVKCRFAIKRCDFGLVNLIFEITFTLVQRYGEKFRNATENSDHS